MKSLAELIGERARSRLFEMCRVVKMPSVEDYRLQAKVNVSYIVFDFYVNY